MNKKYIFKGSSSGKSIVLLENEKISITRKGIVSFFMHGLKGTKTIDLNAITSIQLKKSGFSAGYIQFVLMGSQESKGGLQSALQDENTIGFTGKQYNKQAIEIKQHIEEYKAEKHAVKNISTNINDKYDQLAKIKKLLDEGTLSNEEFDIEKKRILK